MKLTKLQLREIIREEIKHLSKPLSEDYYDYYRDYKHGLIDKKTYDDLVAWEKSREREANKHPYARYKDEIRKYGEMKIYFNIPYSMKDQFKSYYGAGWDSKRKQWYRIAPKMNTKFSTFGKYYDENGTDPNFRKYVKI